ncbi:RDD family protein [Roseovarius sp. SCSIO 43702]|uniref:RDD family protein n=1 Tax=Roseovarius sp. SCSIO 43702 TaxID=2823043 RepID=UPI001C7351F2|nr:RDD family protein [Roseovarius sp. SCSIO 43702]QYX55721.1 RDD family protein [Roseovarius sp. SCSIO 43702]
MTTTTVNRNLGIRRLENYLPPEGVPIAFDIAGLGARLGAQILDIVITFGSVLVLLWVLIWINILSWSAFATLFILLIFFVRIPYYILAELVWNGRTLGKRMVKIRVISADGTRLSPYQVTARNLMKEIEVFTPISMLLGAGNFHWIVSVLIFLWSFGVLFVPLFNKRRQRLGDMIAGTVVVDQPKTVLLPDLTQANLKRSTGARFVFDPSHLGIYGRYELQVLEQILRDPPKTIEARERVAEVVATILRKIDYPERVARTEEWEFLHEFYTQQREFLESRHLFGDSRENKFHDKAPTPERNGGKSG